MKVILYGVNVENNFGGPSIIHGTIEMIKKYKPDSEIIVFQKSKLRQDSIKDINAQILQLPGVNLNKLFIFSILKKIGLKINNPEIENFLKIIISADLVVNLLGICFCDKLTLKKPNIIKTLKLLFGTNLISFIAKLHGIKSIKSASSFGPARFFYSKLQAWLSYRFIFDLMFAREKESMTQLCNYTKKSSKIYLSPDFANLMHYPKPSKIENRIGISISHQIIKQWESTEPYLNCISNLIKKIRDELNVEIVLIPNETTKNNYYNDIHVAKDICNKFNDKKNLSILNFDRLTSTELKSFISECNAVIASRYHCCVASLSSGVPTLVIGWHYKYIELLELYGQDKWILSSKDCSSDKLSCLFDEFWNSRENIRSELKSRFCDVNAQLLNIGKIMISKKE